MPGCVIFGGAGFIGRHLARRLLATKRFEQVHLADLVAVATQPASGLNSSVTDVRKPIPPDLTAEPPEWIFNLAAVHREPGHTPDEYFETNVTGAETVTRYAEAVGCSRIFFASSISVYGPTDGPTDETSPIRPVSSYGASKYPAELIHERWQVAERGRRLIICRPGVIYGPGDPGNILRMVRAIRRGYFAFPGSSDIRKSYGYIEGVLDSIEFMMDRPEPLVRYNYVEDPTETLGDVVAHVKRHFGSRAPVLALPLPVLLPVAVGAQAVLGKRSPLHPVRVRKAARPTHIVPRVLRELGFRFRFNFASSLEDWRHRAPEDFA